MLKVEQAYSLMLLVCGAGIVIDALERMASRSKYSDQGLYSWVVLRQGLAALPRPVKWLADALCAGSDGLMIVLAIRLVAVALVVTGQVDSQPFSLGLTALLITHVYLAVRTAGFGTIGSDSMTLVICGGAWLGTVVADGPEAARAGMWFVAGQSCLGYAVAGLAKLRAPKWRSGEAMATLLSTYTYGNPRLHAFVSSRPKLSQALCWSVILWETTFAVVLVVPEPLMWPLFAIGVFFHASLAALMGLNLFLFAFSSTYVAIWAVRL